MEKFLKLKIGNTLRFTTPYKGDKIKIGDLCKFMGIGTNGLILVKPINYIYEKGEPELVECFSYRLEIIQLNKIKIL